MPLHFLLPLVLKGRGNHNKDSIAALSGSQLLHNETRFNGLSESSSLSCVSRIIPARTEITAVKKIVVTKRIIGIRKFCLLLIERFIDVTFIVLYNQTTLRLAVCSDQFGRATLLISTLISELQSARKLKVKPA